MLVWRTWAWGGGELGLPGGGRTAVRQRSGRRALEMVGCGTRPGSGGVGLLRGFPQPGGGRSPRIGDSGVEWVISVGSGFGRLSSELLLTLRRTPSWEGRGLHHAQVVVCTRMAPSLAPRPCTYEYFSWTPREVLVGAWDRLPGGGVEGAGG